VLPSFVSTLLVFNYLTLKELFENTNDLHILDFIKDIGIINKFNSQTLLIINKVYMARMAFNV